MKVYVCYEDYNYEGCTEPKKVFLKEEDAKEWCIKEQGETKDYPTYEYLEIEVE